MSLPSKYFLNKKHRDFVYFSPLTVGTVGRAVKIYKNLFLSFFCAVDPSTHDGQLIIRQIEALKTVPSVSPPSPRGKQGERHVQQLVNVKDAFEHVLVTKSVQVYYRLSQEEGDKTPTVYITEVRSVLGGVYQEPGLYEMRAGRGFALVNAKMKNRTVDGRSVYINGSGEDLIEGMNSARIESGRKNIALFYNPVSTINDLGVWSTSIRSKVTHQSVDELTQVLRENQNPKTEINWIVEGAGAALLAKAVKEFGGSLQSHSFKFINAQANTPELLQNLSLKKATLKDEFFNYSRSQSALIAMASHAQALKKQISELPGNEGFDKITRRYLMEQVEALGQVGAVAVQQSHQLSRDSQHGKTMTFVSALNKAGVHRR